MQITERNYPVLEKLKNGKLGKCDTHFKDIQELMYVNETGYKVINLISVNFQISAQKYAKNVFYVCKSLDDAIKKSCTSIDKIPKEEFISEFWKKDHHGTLIYNGLAYCYEFNKDKTQSLYLFHGNHLVCCVTRGVMFKSKALGNDIADFFDNLFYILFFIDHAKVETREIKPGGKETFNSDKWVNNSRKNITVIDSLWFTTLVRSGAFNVRGHFRLQPYKDRKELIWINEFEKKGYTRNAKKLSFFNEDQQ